MLDRLDDALEPAVRILAGKMAWDEMKQKDERELERLVTHMRQHLDKEPAAKAA